MEPTKNLHLERITSVCARTGLSRTKIYQLIGQGWFPRPVKVGSSSYWVMDEIDRCIQVQMAMWEPDPDAE